HVLMAAVLTLALMMDAAWYGPFFCAAAAVRRSDNRFPAERIVCELTTVLLDIRVSTARWADVKFRNALIRHIEIAARLAQIALPKAVNLRDDMANEWFQLLTGEAAQKLRELKRCLAW